MSDICLDGKVDGDRHLGHIMLECFKKRKPNDICQIDDATGEEETYGSMLKRIVLLAQGLRRAGLRPGDVMVVSGRSHLNLRVPFFAGMMNGLPVAMIRSEDLNGALAILQPKIIFCDYEEYENYTRAVKNLGLDTKIVTFYEGECSMANLMKKEGNENKTEEFRPACFDTDKVYVWLLSTSGTTGAPKIVAVSHAAAVARLKFRITMMGCLKPINDGGQMTSLELSPGSCSTAYYKATMSPLMNTRLVQSSRSKITVDTYYGDLINKYKPSILMTNPVVLSHLTNCDLTSLDVIASTTFKLNKTMFLQLRGSMRKDAKIIDCYAMNETGVILFKSNGAPFSRMTDIDMNELKLMDVTTGMEIAESYKPGEMWVRGSQSFTEYYKNPEETAKTITKDGWIKTGDILYKDEQGYFYYMERLKMVIRFVRLSDKLQERIFPCELEEVILSHPGVAEVCVVGVPDTECFEVPLACVVRAPGAGVTAQQIKALVADQLSEANQLRGGVVFMDSLPKTGTGKVARAKLQELIHSVKRE